VGVRTTNGIIVTTWLTTLIPGSAMVEIDEERGVMIFHVLDAADPDAFRSSLDRFYERYQRHVFP
ncbi:MAG TPA: cation transporter, partial [Chloroflexi bacterium]|nr:cation transporter [Chloroflexota bacterium]